MTGSLVGKRYAAALFQIAKERQLVDQNASARISIYLKKRLNLS